jgi:hypothetical protein
MHHITTDGISTSIVTRELVQLYLAFHSGQSDPLPELTIQYADYASWQRTIFTGEERDRQLRYWTERVHGAQSLEFPGRPASARAAPTWSGNSNQRDDARGIYGKALTDMARAEQVTMLTIADRRVPGRAWRYNRGRTTSSSDRFSAAAPDPRSSS